MAGSASAHRVNVFAWVEGDTIHVEGKFASGKKVKAGKIAVMDPQGVELLSGLTGDQGEFSFKAPRRADLKIVLIAGQGHQGEWVIRADEMNDLPSETGTETGAQSTPKETDSKKAASVLDKKLKPINRTLSELQQEGPTVKDIFAGIGYILGLVGIAAYVHSRKKKA
jgi:nickel transport protein